MVTIKLRNRLEDLERLEESLREVASAFGIPEQEILGVNLALEELITNVISHGHDDGLEHEISIELDVIERDLKIDMLDDGRPFDPADAEQPDIDEPLHERRIGGLGLHLVRNLVDEVSYTRVDGKNLTTLLKRSVLPGS
jgi:serine/threonine-protein kinase RsbW